MKANVHVYSSWLPFFHSKIGEEPVQLVMDIGDDSRCKGECSGMLLKMTIAYDSEMQDNLFTLQIQAFNIAILFMLPDLPRVTNYVGARQIKKLCSMRTY